METANNASCVRAQERPSSSRHTPPPVADEEDVPLPNRTTSIIDPVSGDPIVIDLDRFPPCSPSRSYRGYEIATGPYKHYYLSAIFLNGRCEAIEGPAANGATALLLAKQWVDEVLAGDSEAEGRTQLVVVRALQKLDAVAQGPTAVMRCDEPHAQAEICSSIRALCDEVAVTIRWLAKRSG